MSGRGGPLMGALDSISRAAEPERLTFAIAVRGYDQRGSFNLQTQITAASAAAALDIALVRWAIDEKALERIHVQLATEGPER